MFMVLWLLFSLILNPWTLILLVNHWSSPFFSGIGTSLALLEDMAVDEAKSGVLKSRPYSGGASKRNDPKHTGKLEIYFSLWLFPSD